MAETEPLPVETPALADALAAPNAIAEASKAALAKLTAAKVEAATPVETEPAEEAPTEAVATTEDAPTEVTEEAPVEEAEATEESEEEKKPEPLTVVLEGLAERGEEDLELEVGSPEALERLRRLKNDAMRGKEYRAKMQDVQAKADELAEVQMQVEANPVGFLLEMIQPDRRLEVAQALLTEHFDELQPIIESYLESPVDVMKARLAAKEQAKELAKQTETQSAQMRAARAILAATEALVPEGVEHGLAAQFLRDAERDLIDAVRSRQQVTPENVGAILAKRIRMYGFAEGATPKKATATPVKGVGLSVEAAKAAQAKVKATQLKRTAAAAIAPAGRGTVVTKAPLIPKTATIEEASKLYLRKKSGA